MLSTTTQVRDYGHLNPHLGLIFCSLPAIADQEFHDAKLQVFQIRFQYLYTNFHFRNKISTKAVLSSINAHACDNACFKFHE